MFAVSLPTETNGKRDNPSIIDVANAAYSMVPPAGVGVGVGATTATATNQQLKISDVTWSTRSRDNSMSSTNLEDRLDAARAMLGISPSSVTDGSVGSMMGGRGNGKLQRALALGPSQSSGDQHVEGAVTDTSHSSSTISASRPRSNSAGLEALAFLATQEQEAAAAATAKTTTARTMTTTVQTTLPYSSISLVANAAVTSSDDDSEIMPPPPPRTTVTRRRRSVSNPEGMDKWGLPMTCSTMDHNRDSTSQTMRRLRLVLPASILEEEIAEANAAVIAKERSTASASALAASLLSHKNDMNQSNEVYLESQLPFVEEDESLDHDELLRRARSRLLEDLSQSNLSGEKGVLTLPHSLQKYKEVRNFIMFDAFTNFCISIYFCTFT